MEDYLCARLNSMLEEGRPLNHFALESVVNQVQKFERESLQNGGGRNAVRQEVVQFARTCSIRAGVCSSTISLAI